MTADWVARRVWLAVSPDKALKWSEQLQVALDQDVMDAGTASKFAGRLSFAVIVAADKVGRAYVKPFHAQAHSPLPCGRISVRLRLAAEWFVYYLALWSGRASLKLEMCHNRPHVHLWVDAAGESRMLAAVLHKEGE